MGRALGHRVRLVIEADADESYAARGKGAFRTHHLRQGRRHLESPTGQSPRVRFDHAASRGVDTFMKVPVPPFGVSREPR